MAMTDVLCSALSIRRSPINEPTFAHLGTKVLIYQDTSYRINIILVTRWFQRRHRLRPRYQSISVLRYQYTRMRKDLHRKIWNRTGLLPPFPLSVQERNPGGDVNP